MLHRVYRCRVMHRRRFPLRYRFDYAIFALLLDVDRIADLAARVPFFSHNRWNLLSFHDRDHGGRDGTPLRVWLERLLAGHGIDSDGRILLLAMPRVAGYSFNPLSVYYCFDRHQQLVAVVCEVKNTFGEQHCYVLHEHGAVLPTPVCARRAKAFHVSPFMAIEGEYAFRLSAPGEELSIGIRHVTAAGTQLVAVQRGVAQPASSRNLLAALARTPFMTLKVIAMIHWRALLIWLRGIPLHRKPPAPAQESSQ